jgi:hypothetical protein
MEKLELQDLISLVDSVMPHFNDLWDDTAEHRRYKKAENWTKEQKSKIISQGRLPYNFTAIMNKLNIMTATFRQSATQWDAEAASNPAHEFKAEIASIMLREVERRNKFKHIQSDIFEDGKDLKYGACLVKVDRSELQPRIALQKYLPEDTIWDVNSTEYDRSDALFVGALDYYYRYQIEELWGKISETEFQWGRGEEAFIQKHIGNNKDYDILTVPTIWVRAMRVYHYVVFPDTKNFYGQPVIKKFRKKRDAIRALKELNTPYLWNGLPFEGEIARKEEEKIDKYKFHYGDILEVEETDDSKFPLHFYYAFQSGNDVWSMMDLLKSPQKFMDRIFSQIDYSFGRDIKKLFEVNTKLLAENETPESAIQKITATGEPLFTNAPPGHHAIQEVMGKGVNPQFIQLAGIMQGFLEDYAGGRSFQGLSESANESGRAINLKQMQGQLVVFYLVSNFLRFKESLGECVLDYIKRYDSAERMIKVHGDALSPEMIQLLQQNDIKMQGSALDKKNMFIEVNSGNVPILRDAEIDLVVTETKLTETERDVKFARLAEWGRANPKIASLPSFNKILMSYDNEISKRDKDALLEELTQVQAMEAEMAKEQMNIDKAKVIAQLKNSEKESE